MLNTFILGDTIEEMSKLPDQSVDMILADLPYELTQNKKDKRIEFHLLWEQYERILKPYGVIALYAQGMFYIDLVMSNKKLFKYDLVWDKVLVSGFLNAKKQPLRVHEQIAIFYKKTPVYNPQFTQGKPLHSKGVTYMSKEHKNQNYGEFNMTDDSRKGSTDKYPKSILTFQKPHPSKALHRTEKSVECNMWLIKTYTNEEAIILDNVCGSGTTAEACIRTNRNFICIDNDPINIEIATQRNEHNTTKNH